MVKFNEGCSDTRLAAESVNGDRLMKMPLVHHVFYHGQGYGYAGIKSPYQHRCRHELIAVLR